VKQAIGEWGRGDPAVPAGWLRARGARSCAMVACRKAVARRRSAVKRAAARFDAVCRYATICDAETAFCREQAPPRARTVKLGRPWLLNCMPMRFGTCPAPTQVRQAAHATVPNKPGMREGLPEQDDGVRPRVVHHDPGRPVASRARRLCHRNNYRASSSQRDQILLGADSFLVLPSSVF
jgi:hypothetical protein